MTLDSTFRDVRRTADGPGSRSGRRVTLVLLLVLVVAAAIGVFGVHSATASDRANGYLLSVTYPRTARAGLDVPFTAHVQHTGGFPSSITLADHGEPVLATLKAERVSIDDLMAAARSEGIERFADVRLAVLEANGRISFFTGEPESGASETPTIG